MSNSKVNFTKKTDPPDPSGTAERPKNKKRCSEVIMKRRESSPPAESLQAIRRGNGTKVAEQLEPCQKQGPPPESTIKRTLKTKNVFKIEKLKSPLYET